MAPHTADNKTKAVVPHLEKEKKITGEAMRSFEWKNPTSVVD